MEVEAVPLITHLQLPAGNRIKIERLKPQVELHDPGN